jgi:hypothetical protein
MHRDRRVASVGAAVVGVAAALGTAAACLVFDGKVATDLDAETEAGASPKLTPEPGVLCWPGFGDVKDCPFGSACCLDLGATGWFEPPEGPCASGTMCPGNGFVAFTCDSPYDCVDGGIPGAVCCASAGSGSTCLSASDCQSTMGVVLCNPHDEPPCDNGGECVAAPDGGFVPPGYSLCQ